MAVGRYCIITPEPTRCIENTALFDLEVPGSLQAKEDYESRGYLVIPENEALAEYSMCQVDPNAP
jgi:hypothetical protein